MPYQRVAVDLVWLALACEFIHIVVRRVSDPVLIRRPSEQRVQKGRHTLGLVRIVDCAWHGKQRYRINKIPPTTKIIDNVSVLSYITIILLYYFQL